MIHPIGIECALKLTMFNSIIVKFHGKQLGQFGSKTIYLLFLSLFLLLGTILGQRKSHAMNNASNTTWPILTSDMRFSIPIQVETPTPTNTPITTNEVSGTPTSTATQVPTFTSTEPIGNTVTPTLTGTGTSFPSTSPFTFIPIIAKRWIDEPVEIDIKKYLMCDSLSDPIPIPDNDSLGIEDWITFEEEGLLVDLEIFLDINHTWIGDLRIRLDHLESGYSSVLINRPGVPQSQNGCGLDNIRAILDDQASHPAETKCLGYPAAIAGIFKPDDDLSNFQGILASGTWRLSLYDNNEADSGQLNKWCLHFSISNRLPPPTPTQPPDSLPESAWIYGIYGEDQALPLDCESRSAVDWSNYFGVSINEFEFLDDLSASDNPDVGFVGDVNGVWGQIPPNDYGIHAEPVATLLRDYGIPAAARKSLTWDDIRHEISLSRPVIAWVVGSVINGAPSYYTPQSDQETTIVARYEHTVIVIGYTPDSVIILDGDEIYYRPLTRFLDSWSVLNNMAVYIQSSEDE